MSDQWGKPEQTRSRERLRRALVYFGLAEDPSVSTRKSAEAIAPTPAETPARDAIVHALDELRGELARNTAAVEELSRAIRDRLA